MLAELGVSVGFTVISQLLAPEPDEVPPEAYEEDEDIPTVDQSRAIPKVFGTVFIKSPNLVWYGDSSIVAATKAMLEGQYGSSGALGTGPREPDYNSTTLWPDPRYTSSNQGDIIAYKQYLGLHMIVCLAPAELLGIRIKNRFVWRADMYAYSPLFLSPTPPTNAHSIFLPKFFDGTLEGGGIGGWFTTDSIKLGETTPAGLKNEYLNSVLPKDNPSDDIPDFKGAFGVTARKMYVGLKPTPDPWEMVVSSTDSVDGWLSAYAKIFTPDFLGTTAPASQTVRINGSTNSGTSFGNGVTISGFSPGTTLTFDIAPYVDANSKCAWSIKQDLKWVTTFGVAREDGSTVNFGYGTSDKNSKSGARALWDQPSNTNRTISGSTQYTFWCPDSGPGDNGDFDMDITVTHNGDSQTGVGANTYNAVHLLRDCLISEDWGLGVDPNTVDDEVGSSWETAAIQAHDEGFGLSLAWNKSERVEDFMSRILKLLDASVYQEPGTGMWVCFLNRESSPAEIVASPIFSEANTIQVKDYDTNAPSEITNEIIVNYTDQNTGTTQSASVSNSASIVAQGSVITKVLSYTEIPSKELALRVAQREVTARSVPVTKLVIEVNREAYNLRKSNIFRFSKDAYQISEEVFKVVTIDYGTLGNGTITITALADVFSMPSSSFVATVPSLWSGYDTEPNTLTTTLAVEASHYEVNSASGFTFNESQHTTIFGRASVAAKQEDTVGYAYKTYTNIDDEEFDYVGGDYDFVGHTTLTTQAPPSNSPTTLYYDTDLTISVLLDSFIYVTSPPDGTGVFTSFEVMKVTAQDSGPKTLTVERGLFDTVPQTHAVGAHVWFVGQNHSVLEQDVDSGLVTVVKLPYVGPSGDQEPTQAYDNEVTMAQRYQRPLPPSDLLINAAEFPDTVEDTIDLTWKHRDRTQQLTLEYTLQSDASIGPEAGTTYTYTLTGAVGGVYVNDTGLTGESHSYSPTVMYDTMTLTLKAVRDGLDSFQTHTYTFNYADSTAYLPSTDFAITSDGYTPSTDFSI